MKTTLTNPFYAPAIRRLVPALLAVLLLAPGAARAQIVATLTGTRTAAPGTPFVTYTGAITNNSTSITYVLSYGDVTVTSFPSGWDANNDPLYVSDIAFPTDPDAFAPAPNVSHAYGTAASPLPLFSLNAPAKPGTYAGMFEIFGTPSSDPNFLLTSIPFRLVVAAPEPSGFVLFGLGLLGVAGLTLRVRRRAIH